MNRRNAASARRELAARCATILSAALLSTAIVTTIAHAYGDDRGVLRPFVGGGQWKIGGIFWSDPRSAVSGGVGNAPLLVMQQSNSFYALEVSYGMGPDMMLTVSQPYQNYRMLRNGEQEFAQAEWTPAQVGIQQKLVRWTRPDAQTEIAFAGNAVFATPDQADRSGLRTSDYTVGVGMNRNARSHVATASFAYSGGGYEPTTPPARVSGNASFQVRPTHASGGRDFLVGVEATHTSSSDRKRMTIGPIVNAYVVSGVSVTASYVLPVWEETRTGMTGGGSSFWTGLTVTP